MVRPARSASSVNISFSVFDRRIVIRWSSGSLVFSMVIFLGVEGWNPRRLRHDERQRVCRVLAKRAARQPKPNLHLFCLVLEMVACWGLVGSGGAGLVGVWL